MEERLEFEAVEHTDYIYEIVGVNWLLLLAILAALAAGAMLWRRRGHR